MTLTAKKFEFLTAIKALSSESDFPFVLTSEIIKYFNGRIGESYVRVRLSQLKEEGFLENPVLGGWRLNEKGKKALKEQPEN